LVEVGDVGSEVFEFVAGAGAHGAEHVGEGGDAGGDGFGAG
jgi:hypothetical protein